MSLAEREDMKIEEAIKILHPDTTREAIIEIEYYGGFNGQEKAIKAVEKACVVACECMEKQISKKPYINQAVIDFIDFQSVEDCMECPSCDSFLGYASECKEEHYQFNYCPNCGQKLDWGK